jgi:D-lactate dehydrogenase (cytochrome)
VNVFVTRNVGFATALIHSKVKKNSSRDIDLIMNALQPSPRSRPDEAAIAAVTGELAKRYGNRVVTSAAVREQHGHTLTWIENQPPDLVVFPQTTEEMADIVKLCAAHSVPIVPFGTGTSLEGHVNAPFGGVSVDTSLMKRIIAVPRR